MDGKMDRRSLLKMGGYGILALLCSDTLKGSKSHAQTADVIVKTHCGLCSWECGIDVRIRAGKVVGIEGWSKTRDQRRDLSIRKGTRKL
jgi:anaerobic selenocysteine-containing dehydrogenase